MSKEERGGAGALARPTRTGSKQLLPPDGLRRERVRAWSVPGRLTDTARPRFASLSEAQATTHDLVALLLPKI